VQDVLFRIERGRPTAEELAMLVAVLMAWLAAREIAAADRTGRRPGLPDWQCREHRTAFRDPRSWQTPLAQLRCSRLR
jgi:hypothetical protein